MVVALVILLTNLGTFLVTYHGMRKALIDMGIMPVYLGFIRGEVRSIQVECEVRDSYQPRFYRDEKKFCGHLQKRALNEKR